MGQLSLVICVLVTFTWAYNVEEEIKLLRQQYGDVPMIVAYCDEGGKLEDCADHERWRRLLATDTYCDSALGCFPTNGFWAARPINFIPNSKETINTGFHLFTRRNRVIGQTLSAYKTDTIKNSYFDSSKPTKFIIHGFLESTKAIWFEPMNQELLKNGDFNVIDVDWGGLGASKTLYTQATANTRVVAAEIIYMIKHLKANYGLKNSDVHIIGHSLGAHIAGYVGTNITGLARISGLDPAEPYFQGYSKQIRLDETDAVFVDVIHSDADSIYEVIKGNGGYGTKDLSGHADFFPNGGENQPECKNGIMKFIASKNDLYEGLKMFFACDHDRAVQYFMQSINNCPFNSVSCADYSTFTASKCGIACKSGDDSCNKMGYKAHKPASGTRKYYLQTTGQGTYCATNYRVQIAVENGSEDFKGTIALVFYGQQSLKQTLNVTITKENKRPGETYDYQLGLADTLGKVTRVDLTYTRDLSWWRVISKACSWIGLCYSEIRIQQVSLVDSSGSSMRFCGSGVEYPSGVVRHMSYTNGPCQTSG